MPEEQQPVEGEVVSDTPAATKQPVVECVECETHGLSKLFAMMAKEGPVGIYCYKCFEENFTKVNDLIATLIKNFKV